VRRQREGFQVKQQPVPWPEVARATLSDQCGFSFTGLLRAHKDI
jgi:hypothetical protein